MIPVATIHSRIDIRPTIAKTYIPNGDAEVDWNSQNWVGDALERLVVANLLDEKDKERAVDEMVDAAMEAEDEDVG